MITAKTQAEHGVPDLLDIDNEIATFERDEKQRLGLPAADRHWRDTSQAAARAQALAANAAAAEMGLVRLGVRKRDSETISRI